MQWELDHVFLACPDVESVAAMLSGFGLSFTQQRLHQGQGTANVCAVFENAFFELLFPVDSSALQSQIVKPLGLMQRIYWQETGACPFGICYRPVAPLRKNSVLPFQTWSYTPQYLTDGASIPIVTPRDSCHEPLVFLSARAGSKADKTGSTPEHRGASRTLTQISIQYPGGLLPSSNVAWFVQNGLLSLEPGPGYHLDLIWDNGVTGKRRDFGPQLPLTIRW